VSQIKNYTGRKFGNQMSFSANMRDGCRDIETRIPPSMIDFTVQSASQFRRKAIIPFTRYRSLDGDAKQRVADWCQSLVLPHDEVRPKRNAMFALLSGIVTVQSAASPSQ
jgi:hypothetical protein